MREFLISHTGDREVWALDHGQRLIASVCIDDRRSPLLLRGSSAIDLAAVAMWAIAEGRAIVLEPDGVCSLVPGTRLTLSGGVPTCSRSGRSKPVPWHVAMYSSGSMGPPRGFGFTLEQLDQLAAWYRSIYRASSASVLITQLPVTYSFTFVAGVYLAAQLGARLHLATSSADLFASAAWLAPRYDRCVVLANPVLLGSAPPSRLAGSVLIDSGGAPLSTWTITHCRSSIGDVREGYGLTETGSLTHFDTEADFSSVGTVGHPMGGVRAQVVDIDGKPRLHITTPVIGVPVEDGLGRPSELITRDLGRIDDAGRLRLLGRADDHCVNGHWPRDTLDLIGPILGMKPALVSHPSPDSVQVRLRGVLSLEVTRALQSAVATKLGIRSEAVSVDHRDTPLLHSYKIPRQEG